MIKYIFTVFLLVTCLTGVNGDSYTRLGNLPASFDTTAKDYQGGKRYDPVNESPRTNWNKPIPDEHDIKCPKCGGSGTVKIVTGNTNPKVEIKMCKFCNGKGTVGRTKKQQ